MVRYLSLLYLKIDLKGHSQLWDLADLDTSFEVWKAFISTWNQMYTSDTTRNPLNLAYCFIRSSIFYWKPLFFTNPFTIFYHIWLKTVSKGTWIRVDAGREESSSFNKITREMNQIHWRANNHFTYLKIDVSSYVYVENQSFSALNPRQWFRLCVISHLY